MRTICRKIIESIESGNSLVLVTLIEQEGSAPRGVGAQMLVDASGRIAGTIGGGAIEGKAIRMGGELLEKKESAVQDFSLNLSSGTDLGMVCGGSVKAYFAYIDGDAFAWKEAAEQVLFRFENRLTGYVVLDLEQGTVLVRAKEEIDDSVGSGRLEGNLFTLPIPLEERVILFGGGHVAQALVPILAGVGFSCIVFENRPEFADKSLFPAAHRVLLGDYKRVEDTLTLLETDYIVIMTNGHLHDLVLEEQLLRRKFAYIGVMGSHRKIAAVNEKLREAGISEEAISSVHTPIGLDILAVTPAEIAISVAAECIQVRALAGGGRKKRHCPA
ncbi:MAG: XdhC family protein [Acetatifactor sp.]